MYVLFKDASETLQEQVCCRGLSDKMQVPLLKWALYKSFPGCLPFPVEENANIAPLKFYPKIPQIVLLQNKFSKL